MRRMTCGMVALLALWALPVMAAGEKWTVSVQGGPSVPSGDFGNANKANAETGWSIGASADYAWTTSWALGIDASWGKNTSGAEGRVTNLGGGVTSSIDEARFSTWQLGGHARYFLPSGSAALIHWYGIVGAGVYGFDQDVTETISSGSSSTSNTLHVLDKRAGMKLGLGGLWWANANVGVLAGVDYHIAFLDKDDSSYSSLTYASTYLGLTFPIPQPE